MEMSSDKIELHLAAKSEGLWYIIIGIIIGVPCCYVVPSYFAGSADFSSIWTWLVILGVLIGIVGLYQGNKLMISPKRASYSENGIVLDSSGYGWSEVLSIVFEHDSYESVIKDGIASETVVKFKNGRTVSIWLETDSAEKARCYMNFREFYTKRSQ